MGDGRVEDLSVTFPHGRGRDGYSAMAEVSDTIILEVTGVTILPSAQDFLGCRDGGGQIHLMDTIRLIHQR